MFGVAALFVCGLGFGAVAALTTQTTPKGKPKPVEVAKAEPANPAPTPATTPKVDPPPATVPVKPEPKPEVRPEPKRAVPTKPEVKKPEPKPEPKTPDPPASAVTFQQVQKVLRDNCTRCHGDPRIEARIDLRTLDSIKKKKGLVEPGDPAASDLWGSIEAGTMPPPEVKTRLTDGEKKVIKDWIAAGAK
jgi:outer membrane biosynthesis protein TonB